MGQSIVVENRVGASGNIGADVVFHSDPDGYTLLAAPPSPLTVNPVLHKNMSFDPTKFVPVVIMTSAPSVLLVRPNFPAKTVQDFFAYAKANPGKINYASQGIGTTSHLTAVLFEQLADIRLFHVPYTGTAPALNDLIGDRVDMFFTGLASALKFHEAGRARILAVASLRRISSLPDIPTLDEIGLKGFQSGTWNVIVAPPGTPPKIVEKLNKAVNAVLHSVNVKDLFAKGNLHVEGGTTVEAATFIMDQTQLWSHVIAKAHISAQ